MTAIPPLDTAAKSRQARSELLQHPAYKIGWHEAGLAVQKQLHAYEEKNASIVARMQRDIFRLAADLRALDDDARTQLATLLRGDEQGRTETARLGRQLQEQQREEQAWRQQFGEQQAQQQHELKRQLVVQGEAQQQMWQALQQVLAAQEVREQQWLQRTEALEAQLRTLEGVQRQDQDQNQRLQALWQKTEQALDQQGRWSLALQSLSGRLQERLDEQDRRAGQQVQLAQDVEARWQDYEAALQHCEQLVQVLRTETVAHLQRSTQLQEQHEQSWHEQQKIHVQIAAQASELSERQQRLADLESRLQPCLEQQEQLQQQAASTLISAQQQQAQTQGLLSQVQSLWMRLQDMEQAQQQASLILAQQQQVQLAYQERLQEQESRLQEADHSCRSSREELDRLCRLAATQAERESGLLERIEAQAERESDLAQAHSRHMQLQAQLEASAAAYALHTQELQEQLRDGQLQYQQAQALNLQQQESLQAHVTQVQHWQQLTHKAMHKLKEFELELREFKLGRQEHQWLLQQARQDQTLLQREKQDWQARLQHIEMEIQEMNMQQELAPQDESWRPLIDQLRHQVLEIKIDLARRPEPAAASVPLPVAPRQVEVAKRWWQRRA